MTKQAGAQAGETAKSVTSFGAAVSDTRRGPVLGRDLDKR